MSTFKNYTAKEIRQAVDQGKTVFVDSYGYKVIKDKIGQYLIVCNSNGHCIGLTWQDGQTLNAETFLIEGVHEIKTELPERIDTAEQAKAYINELSKNGELYHFEDPAASCFGNAAGELNTETAKKMDKLADQLLSIEGFDPFAYVMDNHPIKEL